MKKENLRPKLCLRFKSIAAVLFVTLMSFQGNVIVIDQNGEGEQPPTAQ